MTNHVHLALQTGAEPLSHGMHNLAFRYTRHVNAARKRVGHLFEGRYKAFLVDQDRYGLELVRYQHLNPVRAGVVTDASDYPWSGHRAYLGQTELPWLTTDWVLGQFGATAGVARRRYARFVVEGAGQGHRDEFYGGEQDSRIVGEEEFVARSLPPDASPTRPPSLAAIQALVCQAYGLAPDHMHAPGRARLPSRARAALAWLCIRTKAATLVELSSYTGRDASTLSHGVAALSTVMESDAAERERLDTLFYAAMQA